MYLVVTYLPTHPPTFDVRRIWRGIVQLNLYLLAYLLIYLEEKKERQEPHLPTYIVPAYMLSCLSSWDS